MTREQKYIQLIVKKGINLQKGQKVFLSASIENVEFIKKLVENLYENGASDVYVNWECEEITKLALIHKNSEDLKQVDEWIVQRYKQYVEDGAAILRIESSDPELLKDVPKDNVAIRTKAMSKALSKYKTKVTSDENSWCIACVPSKKWAQKIFPSSKTPEVDLWNAIFETVKVDEQTDAIENWDQHLEKLQKMTDYLNEQKFESLRYENNLGTNLQVGLVDGHIWLSGDSQNINNKQYFIANMPTEEIFTMPNKNKVDGKVYATKPLNYNGNLIEDFWIEFENGKAINWDAKKNKDILTTIINSDAGSMYLGEVALVEATNPIARQNIIYYNTLFDENASCHLAFGQAYSSTINTKVNEDEKAEIGFNESIIHVDFMIGNEEMNIYGVKENKEIQIMKNGEFVINN